MFVILLIQKQVAYTQLDTNKAKIQTNTITYLYYEQKGKCEQNHDFHVFGASSASDITSTFSEKILGRAASKY